MLKETVAPMESPRRRLILQAVGFLLLTAVLFHILSGPRALLFLQSIIGGLCALWLIKEPHWVVLSILALWLLRFSPAFLGISYLRIPYLISAVLLVALVLLIIRERALWAWRLPQVKILTAIGILFLASTGWNYYRNPITLVPELDQTMEIMQQFFTRLIFLVLFLSFMRTSKQIELAAWVVILIIVASALNALYLFSLPGAGRAWASFGIGRNPNRLAFFCLLGASLLWFYRSYRIAPRWKTVTFLLFLPLPALALASGSRAGFLQLIAFLALIFKEQEGWSVAKRLRSLLFLGAVSLVFLLIIPTSSLLRATTFEASWTAPGGKSMSDRIQTVLTALEMVAQDPVFGIGPGNFTWMHQAFYGTALATHNSYIWALVSGGIGALVLYLFLLAGTYRMLRRLERSGPHDLLWLSKGLRIGLVLFMIASAFADLWHSDLLYAIVGLTGAMAALSLRRSQADLRIATPVPSRVLEWSRG